MSGNPSSPSYEPANQGPSSAGAGLSSSGPQASGDRCVIDVTTTLASPDAAEVLTLAIGEVLSLELQENPPAVVAVRSTGARVGAITQRAADFSACIQAGYHYDAQVTNINGGAITVHITTLT